MVLTIAIYLAVGVIAYCVYAFFECYDKLPSDAHLTIDEKAMLHKYQEAWRKKYGLRPRKWEPNNATSNQKSQPLDLPKV